MVYDFNQLPQTVLIMRGLSEAQATDPNVQLLLAKMIWATIHNSALSKFAFTDKEGSLHFEA